MYLPLNYFFGATLTWVWSLVKKSSMPLLGLAQKRLTPKIFIFVICWVVDFSEMKSLAALHTRPATPAMTFAAFVT